MLLILPSSLFLQPWKEKWGFIPLCVRTAACSSGERPERKGLDILQRYTKLQVSCVWVCVCVVMETIHSMATFFLSFNQLFTSVKWRKPRRWRTERTDPDLGRSDPHASPRSGHGVTPHLDCNLSPSTHQDLSDVYDLPSLPFKVNRFIHVCSSHSSQFPWQHISLFPFVALAPTLLILSSAAPLMFSWPLNTTPPPLRIPLTSFLCLIQLKWLNYSKLQQPPSLFQDVLSPLVSPGPGPWSLWASEASPEPF